MTLRYRILSCLIFAAMLQPIAVTAQVENVPVANQVYEFLDRLGVEGILPLYSNTMIPIPRKEVAAFLKTADQKKEYLSDAERAYLDKFKKEFAHEFDPDHEESFNLFRDGFDGILSDKEKYLYSYTDSSVSAYVDFLGSAEHRRASGDTYGTTHSSFETHGGRIRGTILNSLGFYLQGTNGTLFGNKTLALSDPHLRSNVKFNDLNSPYFDVTEGYLRAETPWFGIEFGRENTLVGTGYSDRLLLSDNSPAFDELKIDAHYKSLRFLFIHGSILSDSSPFPGLSFGGWNDIYKYLSLHRIQLSLLDKLNIGLSEMIIYRRYSPEFAYLNPIIFFKSVEHSLRDRDNAFLNLDVEYFLHPGYKAYGTILIDDIDFSKIGTGWWGNELGWQGGLAMTNLAGLQNVDAVVEYTRIDPYVYSNRTSGNDYSNNNIGLGHHLPPNSDELFVQFAFRPAQTFRAWLGYGYSRHGDNITNAGGDVVENVGGNVLQGHRDWDSPTVSFLAGNRSRRDDIQLRAAWEPVRDLFISGSYELQRIEQLWISQTAVDHFASIKIQIGK
jgi:hypothetical protein